MTPLYLWEFLFAHYEHASACISINIYPIHRAVIIAGRNIMAIAKKGELAASSFFG